MTNSEELLRTPAPMLEWLRAMPADAIATQDVCDPRGCLVANFLRANGFPQTECGGFRYYPVGTTPFTPIESHDLPAWFTEIFLSEEDRLDMPAATPISAGRAIEVIERHTNG